MPYTPQEKSKAIARLRRIGGQAQALDNNSHFDHGGGDA
jgi:DNA-binding FrmR family transcriptional regulator